MPVWQKSMDLAVVVFELTEKFPKKEDYGITSQLRRASTSIASNIAEAYGRKHTLDKINFYYYSRGSVTEVQSHLEYCLRVNYLDKEIVKKLDSNLYQIYNEINKIIKTLK